MVQKKSPKKSRSVNIRMIAEIAQVSPATVSLALRDAQTNRVNPKTRSIILDIAEQLNYRPNYIARALVTKETRTIGLVITTLSNPFYAEMAQDILLRAEELGYSVLIYSLNDTTQGQEHLVKELLRKGVDGLIISSSSRKDELVKNLSYQETPFVLVMRNVAQAPGEEEIDFVGLDNLRGAYIATEHLLKMGHRRIAHIAGPETVSTGYDRKNGWSKALEAWGIKPGPELLLNGNFTRESGYENTLRLIQQSPSPTAIFASNDIMALGVLEALREKGVKVPDQMSVIGFDDIEMAGLIGIDLTTISQEKSIMGRLCIDRLVSKITGESENVTKRLLLNPILKIRETCGFNKCKSQYSYEGLD